MLPWVPYYLRVIYLSKSSFIFHLGVLGFWGFGVLVGDSISLDPGDYSVPPLKKDSQVDRFDSINNNRDGHYIIYDNSRCYPGYLITYE
jgi:hypothetical protein